MLGVVGGTIVIGGLLASRRNGKSTPPHSDGGLGVSAIVIGGLLITGVAGAVYVISRNGSSPKALPAATAKHYKNKKEWEITYNKDGLPIKIVKHVDAEITDG